MTGGDELFYLLLVEMKVVLCLILLIASVFAYEYGNCNHGLDEGLYYCKQNDLVPFTMTIGAANNYHGHDDDFQIEARAFGCVDPIYGEYDIFANTITFTFVQSCDAFYSNPIVETFLATFEDGCFEFQGINAQGNKIKCILAEFDPDYYVAIMSADATTITLSFLAVFLLALLI